MNGQLLPVIFVTLILVLYLIYHFLRKANPEPGSRRIYSDLSSSGKIIVSNRYRISGKPDMIMRKGRYLVPFEYKSTDADRPRSGHLLQMAAYFLILEENFPELRVDHGVLEYRRKKFRIENSRELRDQLLKTVHKMRGSNLNGKRNHNNPGKCFRCSFKDSCLQNLITAKR
ncbi:MAG: PD-(D/E)XK nuclease family protein [Thermoplasmataceae archaeon]